MQVRSVVIAAALAALVLFACLSVVMRPGDGVSPAAPHAPPTLVPLAEAPSVSTRTEVTPSTASLPGPATQPPTITAGGSGAATETPSSDDDDTLQEAAAAMEQHTGGSIALTGVVLDEHGSAVPHVAILARSVFSGISTEVAGSGDDGRFEAMNVQPDCLVFADHPDYASVNDFHIKEGVTGELRLLVTSAVASLHGTVTSADGTPVAGASVRLSPIEDGHGSRRKSSAVVSAADGAFHFSRVVAERHSLTVRAEGLRGRSMDLRLEVGVDRFIAVHLDPLGTASITGIVREEDATPIPNALVRVAKLGSSEYVSTSSSSDDGSYRIENLPAGDVDVIAARIATGVDARTTLTLANGVETEWIAVLPPARIVHGAVVREDGVPLSGWWVEAELATGVIYSATSDADGVFRIEGANTGEYRLTASAEKFRPPAVSVPGLIDGGPHRLIVPDEGAMARVKGRVVNEQGAPLASALLYGGGADDGRGNTMTDTEGQFELGPFAPGEIRVIAYLDGYAPSSHWQDAFCVQVAAGSTLDLGSIVLVALDRTAEIVVHLKWPGFERKPMIFPVLFRDHEEWSQAHIEQLEVDGATARSTKFLRPDRYRLWVLGSGIAEQTIPIEIHAYDEVREIYVPLRPGANRMLRLTRSESAGHAPLEYCRYNVSAESEGFHTMRVVAPPSPTGIDELEVALPLGSYDLRVECNGFALSSHPIEVTADESAPPIEIHLPAAR